MTLHPLIKLALSQPHLLSEHLLAYVALLADEAKKASASMVVRIVLYAGAGLLALVGLVLIGVALLFSASIPSANHPATWALVVVPLVPCVAAVVMVLIARSKPIEGPFDALKEQAKADLTLLKEVSST